MDTPNCMMKGLTRKEISVYFINENFIANDKWNVNERERDEEEKKNYIMLCNALKIASQIYIIFFLSLLKEEMCHLHADIYVCGDNKCTYIIYFILALKAERKYCHICVRWWWFYLELMHFVLIASRIMLQTIIFFKIFLLILASPSSFFEENKSWTYFFCSPSKLSFMYVFI